MPKPFNQLPRDIGKLQKKIKEFARIICPKPGCETAIEVPLSGGKLNCPSCGSNLDVRA